MGSAHAVFAGMSSGSRSFEPWASSGDHDSPARHAAGVARTRVQPQMDADERRWILNVLLAQSRIQLLLSVSICVHLRFPFLRCAKSNDEL